MTEEVLNLEEFYQTTDLNCATSLYYLGHKINSIDKTNPSKSIFLIERKNGIDGDIKRFWNKELVIEPQLYSACLREVKNRLYNTVEH